MLVIAEVKLPHHIRPLWDLALDHQLKVVGQGDVLLVHVPDSVDGVALSCVSVLRSELLMLSTYGMSLHPDKILVALDVFGLDASIEDPDPVGVIAEQLIGQIGLGFLVQELIVTDGAREK